MSNANTPTTTTQQDIEFLVQKSGLYALSINAACIRSEQLRVEFDVNHRSSGILDRDNGVNIERPQPDGLQPPLPLAGSRFSLALLG